MESSVMKVNEVRKKNVFLDKFVGSQKRLLYENRTLLCNLSSASPSEHEI